jgi:hypothetical protein
VSHFTADSQSVSMSCCRAHFVNVWPDIASFSRVWDWNLLSCLVGRPLWREAWSVLCKSQSSQRVTLRLRVSQLVSQPVSQYVLVSSWLCGRLTRYCLLFKSLGLEFVGLSLWSALSDERPGLSFVSHSLVKESLYGWESVIQERSNKHHEKMEIHSNTTLWPLLEQQHRRRLKKSCSVDLIDGWRGPLTGEHLIMT